jgi:hypothetical protein
MTNTETQTREADPIDDMKVRQTPFRDKLANVPMRPSGGGVQLDNLEQQLTYAQLMAKDALLIPEHLYNNPGTCLAVVDLAQRWQLSPFMVAKQTYMVPGNKDKGRPPQFGFMSQLLHAIIEKWAPIEHRLRMEIGRLEPDGQGGERWVKNRLEPANTKRCRVWTRIRGEVQEVEYISPTLAGISPKNSPLWETDPDQQLFYFSSARLARRYFPDVLMGVYSVDEIMDAENQPHVGFGNAKVVPQLQQRLEAGVKHENAEGFSDGIVERTLEGATVGGTATVDGEAEQEFHDETPEAKPKKPPRRAPKAKPTAAVPPHAPANAEEYEKHLRAWLAQQDDPDVVAQLWGSEFKLRRACGCGGGETGAAMVRLKDARIKELSR